MSEVAVVSPGTLLDDRDMVDFIICGYILLDLKLAAGVREQISEALDGMESNPGDAITDAVPELGQVLDHPLVHGALTSLAGMAYEWVISDTFRTNQNQSTTFKAG